MHSMCVMVVTQCSLLLAVLLAAVAFCDARYGIVEYYILLMRFCVPKRRVGSSAKHKQRCCIATLPHLAVSSSRPMPLAAPAFACSPTISQQQILCDAITYHVVVHPKWFPSSCACCHLMHGTSCPCSNPCQSTSTMPPPCCACFFFQTQHPQEPCWLLCHFC